MRSNEIQVFRDRSDAGQRLGQQLKGRKLHSPLVLGIPRGGVVTGFALAREISSELDVVLSRKLRAPYQPEYAIGAVSENGEVTLNPAAADLTGVTEEYLNEEVSHQLREIARRKKMFRAIRPLAPIAGRSVIVTDDGVATGSTMIAALQSAREQEPHELIAAVPVAAPDRLEQIKAQCNEAICLLVPENFYAVGQFYEVFQEVDDEEVVRLLAEATSSEHAINE